MFPITTVWAGIGNLSGVGDMYDILAKTAVITRENRYRKHVRKTGLRNGCYTKQALGCFLKRMPFIGDPTVGGFRNKVKSLRYQKKNTNTNNINTIMCFLSIHI